MWILFFRYQFPNKVTQSHLTAAPEAHNAGDLPLRLTLLEGLGSVFSCNRKLLGISLQIIQQLKEDLQSMISVMKSSYLMF